MRIKILVESAVAMVHSTMEAFLKKAEMNQLPSLIVAMAKEAVGCLEGLLKHSMNIDEEDAKVLALLMILHAGPDIHQFAPLVVRDFERLTGRKPPEEITKFVMVDDDAAIDKQTKEAEGPAPKKKSSGGVH